MKLSLFLLRMSVAQGKIAIQRFFALSLSRSQAAPATFMVELHNLLCFWRRKNQYLDSWTLSRAKKLATPNAMGVASFFASGNGEHKSAAK